MNYRDRRLHLAAPDKNYGSCVVGELFEKQSDIEPYVQMKLTDLSLSCGIVIGRSAEPNIDRTPIEVPDYVIGTVE